MTLLSKKDFLHKLNEDYASMNELAHDLIRDAKTFTKVDSKKYEEKYYHTSEEMHKLIEDLSETIKDKETKASFAAFCDSFMSSIINKSTFAGMPGNDGEKLKDNKLALNENVNENQGMTLYLKDKSKQKEYNTLERFVIKTYGSDKEVFSTYPGDKVYISQEAIETDPNLAKLIEEAGLTVA